MKPEKVREVFNGSRDMVFLDSIRKNGEDNRSLLFSGPERILKIDAAGDVAPFFLAAQKALSRGRYLAGWFSYELGYLFHRPLVPLLKRKPPEVPLAWLGIFKAPREIPGGFPLEETISPVSLMNKNDIRLDLEVSKEQFMDNISRIHGHIRNGETYQVNYTVRGGFELPEMSALDLYLGLRNSQRVNYGAFIRSGHTEILCLSPELFFKKTGSRVWSRPMKGTIRRGADSLEDARLAGFLQNDEKNRAENVMIVDLIRNDLGMICRTGTVRVPELFKVEKYETLFQMISRVEGCVRSSASWHELFSALFPCGSITGAPKIKTMEIIAGLEKSPRGVYTGAIGYISPDWDACFNVAIRTIVLQQGRGELGIGSGITIYSNPEAEFEETLLKARFLTEDISYD